MQCVEGANEDLPVLACIRVVDDLCILGRLEDARRSDSAASHRLLDALDLSLIDVFAQSLTVIDGAEGFAPETEREIEAHLADQSLARREDEDLLHPWRNASQSRDHGRLAGSCRHLNQGCLSVGNTNVPGREIGVRKSDRPPLREPQPLVWSICAAGRGAPEC